HTSLSSLTHPSPTAISPLSLHDALPIFQSSDSTEFVEAESLRTNYLGFNTEKEPFDDVKVRQAIDFAIDREELKEGIYNGQAARSEEHTSELQSRFDLVCRLLLEKKKKK